MKKKIDFQDVKLGSAITVRFIETKNKIGFSKKIKDGVVEFYVLDSMSAEERNDLLIKNLGKFLERDQNEIEIIAGNKDLAIVSILGISSTDVNEKFLNA